MHRAAQAHRIRRHTAALASWLLALAAGPCLAQASGKPQLELPRIPLTAGMYRLEVQVASTPAERQTGLMHRTGMPSWEGMLFVFEQPGIQCFWMKNTLIPLTAAFLADDGAIVNLADMQPLDENSHCSAAPVRYVLEANQGWFAERHLQPGVRLRGAPFRPG